ncbi:MAG: threonylcarbamoyl-AMP synthase [Candidatus Fraserbacteria bacterium RBG_16_55_9]|uniref:L-threonylcarbamoyladenylate synthase n=1 Tax=Fraserbacteria sp. (strain RBG_16_55_9) TaxID=1817864 RepID=A0A1F5UWY4_FRAXR|nr:MAG: threonylcarbamoyl-AMP synthase [Candidatus Fraserbacteria bacterium RBG_16_55_9]
MPAPIIQLNVECGLSPAESSKIRDIVRDGKILIFPTDTIYGLGCDAFHESAIRRIHEIKGRAPAHPFSVHVASISELEKYVAPLSKRERILMERLLPGPYTVVLKASAIAPPACVSSEGKIGLRVPNSRSFQLVYEASGRPVVGTSVNRTGQPPLAQVEEIIREFSEHVHLIIATVEPMTQKSSSVIDITFDPPRVLRGRMPEGLP